ncbi:uncharacterized protein FIBRA_05800 [Fibroporia radiculosa]|uniref:Homeobox domain-containing protein n=1 Tax=Fibroporia radiculosa TaxID=599839 RepID=J4IAX2_9APHY|nr:uncharacterized protein FIBRA_05800 [Fibroporia radiculosa]CCM03656.1 predicted protein [Fibroporia radiculosa]
MLPPYPSSPPLLHPSSASPAHTPSTSKQRAMTAGANQERIEQPKKPRHRHSAFQLAALNELYDKSEHPSLEERTSLAERLGMETKTVNSWFQNKRASCKKRHKSSSAGTSTGTHSGHSTKNSSPVNQLPPISALIASVSAAPHPSSHSLAPHDYEGYSDDEPLAHLQQPQHPSLFYLGNPQHPHLFEAEESAPRKGRTRPSAAQTEELRKVYEGNPHPSKEEREALGARIGMRYQSVTNWFQNQRSIAKKRSPDDDLPLVPAHVSLHPSLPAAPSRSRTFSPFPPAVGAAHPSLSVPPATGHPSLAFPAPTSISAGPISRARRSPSAAPTSHRSISHSIGHSSSHPASPRISPYQTSSNRSHGRRSQARPRRTRPEPHQLEALKKLFRRTTTPSIEERGALALEVGMEVGKVTNWFRNLRQTARKSIRSRGMHVSPDGEEDELDEGDIDEDEGDADHYMDVDADDVSLATYNSRNVSRASTPMRSAASMSSAPSPLMHSFRPPPYMFDEVDALPRYVQDPRLYSPPPLHLWRHEHQLDRQIYAAPLRVLPVERHSMRPSVPVTLRSLSIHTPSDPDVDSHMGSEEDYQEAVTPSPEGSPPPPVSVSETDAELEKNAVLEKAAVRRGVMGSDAKAAQFETSVKVEDALLLLSFHQHVVR